MFGVRYLTSKRGSLSLTTRISVMGLALSVAVLLVVQAVLAGFEREMESRILGVLPHINLWLHDTSIDLNKIELIADEIEEITGTSSAIQSQGLVSTKGSVKGVVIIGIDPATYSNVSTLSTYVEGQPLANLTQGAFEVYLGSPMAKDLGVEVGDSVTLVAPDFSVTPAGVFPRQKVFTVRGLVRTHSVADEGIVYVHVDDAIRLFRNRDGVNVMFFRSANPMQSDVDGWILRNRIASELGRTTNVGMTTWKNALGALHDALRTQKNIFLILLSLLVIVAAFNLVSSLVIVTRERRFDVAVLRSIGTGTGFIVSVFVLFGLAIAWIGVVFGIGLGLAIGFLIEWLVPWIESVTGYQIMTSQILQKLPIDFRISDTATIVLIATVASLVATFYPARQAASMNPAEVLQHE